MWKGKLEKVSHIVLWAISLPQKSNGAKICAFRSSHLVHLHVVDNQLHWRKRHLTWPINTTRPRGDTITTTHIGVIKMARCVTLVSYIVMTLQLLQALIGKSMMKIIWKWQQDITTHSIRILHLLSTTHLIHVLTTTATYHLRYWMDKSTRMVILLLKTWMASH